MTPFEPIFSILWNPITSEWWLTKLLYHPTAGGWVPTTDAQRHVGPFPTLTDLTTYLTTTLTRPSTCPECGGGYVDDFRHVPFHWSHCSQLHRPETSHATEPRPQVSAPSADTCHHEWVPATEPLLEYCPRCDHHRHTTGPFLRP